MSGDSAISQIASYVSVTGLEDNGRILRSLDLVTIRELILSLRSVDISIIL